MALVFVSRSFGLDRNALEELSIRASIALGQKKVMHDILCDGQEAEEFENEFAALSAKVVCNRRSVLYFITCLFVRVLIRFHHTGQGYP